MSKVSTRYAKSLFELSLEKGLLEKVYADMQLIDTTCKQNNELILLLKSPVVKTDKKQAILKAVFGNSVQPITIDFINILATKKRESYLPEVAESFVEQYLTHKNILKAVITTAFGLDDELREKVIEEVKKATQSEVELIEKTDKKIIGGYILRVGDKQDDTSISRKLKLLQRTFSENPYIKDF